MALFESGVNPKQNLLPFNGAVYYFGEVLDAHKADFYFKKLRAAIDWQPDKARIFGREIRTQRKVAWYGDTPVAYGYSGHLRIALYWNAPLLELKSMVEKITSTRFNSCLLNLYANGTQGMGWHSDNEKELGEKPIIASLSLGATRKFVFKHKTKPQKRVFELKSGSLLLMAGHTQKHWLHSLPKTKKVQTARINLTFRNIISKGAPK